MMMMIIMIVLLVPLLFGLLLDAHFVDARQFTHKSPLR